MPFVEGYGVQEEGQEESKIQNKTETLEVERVGAERRVCRWVDNKCDGNEDWYDLKSKLLDVVSEVCGYTKGKPRHFETWWWNKDEGVAVRRKRELFRIWRQRRNEEDRKKYC